MERTNPFPQKIWNTCVWMFLIRQFLFQVMKMLLESELKWMTNIVWNIRIKSNHSTFVIIQAFEYTRMHFLLQHAKKNILTFKVSLYAYQTIKFFSFILQLKIWLLIFSVIILATYQSFFVSWILQFLRQISAKFKTFHFCTANSKFLERTNVITINLKELRILTMNDWFVLHLINYQYIFIGEKLISVEMVNFLFQLNINLNTLSTHR